MICQKCGATVPDDSLFCENCGSQLEPLDMPEESSEEIVEKPVNIEDLKVGETGTPEESKEDWFKSFEELAPNDDDWAEGTSESQEEAMKSEDPEPSYDAEISEDHEVQEYDDVETSEDYDVQEFDHEESSEYIEKGVENEHKPTVEDMIEEELPDDSEIPEILSEDSDVIEAESDIEDPGSWAGEEGSEVIEDDEDAPAEGIDIEVIGEKVSEGISKIGGWLANVGKSVHTGTGWAVDAAKEKLASMGQDPEEEKVEVDEETEASDRHGEYEETIEWPEPEPEEPEAIDEDKEVDEADDAEEPEEADEAEEPEAIDEDEEVDETDESEEPQPEDESAEAEEPEEVDESGDAEVTEDTDESEEPEPEEADDPEESEEADDAEDAEETDDVEEPEEADDPEESEEADDAEDAEETDEAEEPEVIDEDKEVDEEESAEASDEPGDAEEPEPEDESDESEEPEPEEPEEVDESGDAEEPEEADDPEEPQPEAKAKSRHGRKHLKSSERDNWSDAEMGELVLSSDFWYSSNKEKPEGANVYDGRHGQGGTSEGGSDGDDMTTKVVPVKTMSTHGNYGKRTTGTFSGKKLKMIVMIATIAVLVFAGILFGTRVHNEKEVEDKYQTAITQAEKYVEAKDYKSAEEIYKNLISQYPNRAELYESLARIYITEERFDDATKIVNEGISKTGKSEVYAALTQEIKDLTSTEWREPYRRVLADNEWAVKRYEDVNDVSVALCDVTGDRKPELFFFTQEYTGYGKLHIYTYVNDKAQEISYSNKNRSTQNDDAFYDVERDDNSYVIYKGKKPGEFGIYESFLHRGVDSWQTINEFTLSGTDCKKTGVIEACIRTDYRLSEEDDEDDNTEYYKNENEVGYKTYIKEFQRILNSIDQVLITSKVSSGEREIWSTIIDMKDSSMDYNDAMKILDEDAN